ncbi:transcription elongation factor A protein 3-like [Rhinophrynus dorsalis]
MVLEEELLKIGRRLERKVNEGNTERILDLLKELKKSEMTVPLLRSTRIGVIVNKIRKRIKERKVGELAKALIKDWKRLLDASYKDRGTKQSALLGSPIQTDSDNHHSPIPKKPHSEKPSENHENPKQPQSQQAAPKDPKLKRSHSTDVQSSIHTTKKSERRLSLNSPLPSSSVFCKSSSNTKEDRKHSLGSPSTAICNGPQKTDTDTKNERDCEGQLGSPTESHKSPACLLTTCYLTGDSVRDKCVDMVVCALKTDDDYKQFGANCERIAWEIEESIYRELKATDMKYRNRVRSRISNLKDPRNPNLRRNVLCGVVTPQRIATMTAEEMASDELRELRNNLTQEAIREHQMAKTGGTQTDLLQCDKCKKKNCTYNQVQTRSADEPMTTFVLCNECGNRWKFC